MGSRTRSLQSKKYLHKKRKRTTFTVIFWLLCVAAVCAGVIFFLRIDRLQIHDVQVAGNLSVDSAEIKAIADSHLAGSNFFFVPYRSYFSYPSVAISAEILSKYPRIGSVQLIRHKDILSVNITERVPSAIVCKKDAGALCLFVDDSAFLYSEAPSQSSKIYLEFSVPSNNASGAATTSTQIGTTFINAKQFHALKDFADEVTKLGFPVTEIELESTGDMRFFTKVGTDILVRYAESYDTTLNNLALFLDKTKQQARAKKGTPAMTSIDLRYGNSVFYKSETGGVSSGSNSGSSSAATSSPNDTTN